MSNNQDAKSLQLEVIDFELIKKRDPEEIRRVVEISSTTGIFFLDLRGPSSKETLANLKTIYKAEDDFFNRPLGEKFIYHEGGTNRGYNHRGSVDVFQISREAELTGELRLSDELEAVRSEIEQVTSFSDAALRDLYQALSLGLDPPAPIAQGEDPQKPGRSELTLARGSAPPKDVIVPEHRDEGLLSILYYEAPHLEIQNATKNGWVLVQPYEGLHPVYVAETLHRSSGGRLNAALHRVVQAEYNAAVASYLLHPARA
ncbi:2og-fe oxygenase family [Fusarium phyllophilum]|uniref:2og-fe oxygenase family n=1 Tax=Fusarium phyllophilum TaxID=47803 RepID=A0A8H5K6E6_9HYPO|nr:2og-fe oxygenase family [Fusarium phyllophilum]